MPLPRPLLRDGFDESLVGGSGFEDFNALLLELHEGVLELTAPEVRCYDDPQFRKSGFSLTDKRDTSRSWFFTITANDLRESLLSLPGHVREAIKTPRGRQLLASLLESGVHPDELERRLSRAFSCQAS